MKNNALIDVKNEFLISSNQFSTFIFDSLIFHLKSLQTIHPRWDSEKSLFFEEMTIKNELNLPNKLQK